MKKMMKIFLVIFSMLIVTQNLVADEQTDLKKHLLNKIDEVIVIVEDKKLSKTQRNFKITNVARAMFDFELMAKLSLGKRAWKKLNTIERKEFTELYIKRMEHSYSSKLDAYNGEKVEVKEIKQAKKNRITFITDLVNGAEKFEVKYKFYKPKKQKTDKDRWLIFDVEMSGVSILKADQTQFKEVLRTKTIYELMEALTK
ncbi:MAG: ABC transporter substrate-binding protein [Campylobacterota bacterium]|nr:ABC transporter substrate-binding protein [Campylobacterota bacterium]